MIDIEKRLQQIVLQVDHIVMVRLIHHGVENQHLIARAGKIDNPAGGGEVTRQTAVWEIGVENPQPLFTGQ